MKLRDALALGVALSACSPKETIRWGEVKDTTGSVETVDTTVDVKGCLEGSEPSIDWTSPKVKDLVPDAEAFFRVAVTIKSACEGVAEDVSAALSLMGESCEVALGDLSPDYQNTLACVFPLQGQPGDWTLAVDLTASNQGPTQKFIDLGQPSNEDCMPNILFAEELAASCGLEAPFPTSTPAGVYVDSPYADLSAWTVEQNLGLGADWKCITLGELAVNLTFATGTSLSTESGPCEGRDTEALAVNTLARRGLPIEGCELDAVLPANQVDFAVDAVCGSDR